LRCAQRLRHRSREPVKHVSASFAGRGDHHWRQDAGDQVIGNEVALRGVRRDLQSQVRPALDLGPEEITGGDVRGTSLGCQPPAVRAFPCARWRQHDRADHDDCTTSSPASALPAQYLLSDLQSAAGSVGIFRLRRPFRPSQDEEAFPRHLAKAALGSVGMLWPTGNRCACRMLLSGVMTLARRGRHDCAA
jgi:hypothetical protein